MRHGVMLGGRASHLTVDDYIEQGRSLEALGLDTVWIPHVFGHDAITCAALMGRETTRIELGTAVVPTFPRHPTAIAQQALTTGAACRGRFTLGIGLSHPPVIERMIGLSYARRANHMREYLAVLAPMLRGGSVKYEGEEYRVDMSLDLPGSGPVPLVVAALGDRMLEIAGRETTGTILWMVGFRGLEHHIIPKLRSAAAGRQDPRIVASMHIVLTSNPSAARQRIAEVISQYRLMPSYAAMIEREGSSEPTDFAILGDEKALDAGLERLENLGVTDFNAHLLELEEGGRQRTLEYLASRVQRNGNPA